MINCAARSRARRGSSASTPRSARCAASVCMPSLRARPRDRRRREVRGFEKHILRRRRDARRMTAHGRRQARPGASASVISTNSGSSAISRSSSAGVFRRCARGARRSVRAAHRHVERVQRLTEFEHHVALVTSISRLIERKPQRRRRSGHPQRRLCRHVDAVDESAAIARAISGFGQGHVDAARCCRYHRFDRQRHRRRAESGATVVGDSSGSTGSRGDQASGPDR